MRQLLAMLVLGVPLMAQSPATPWALSNIRPVVAGATSVNTVLAATGDVYLWDRPANSPFDWPQPSKTYGDPKYLSNLISRYDPAGRLAWTVALGGTYIISAHPDSVGNLFVSGTAAPSSFFTTPGAYRWLSPGDPAIFVCKLRASDGEAQYCTYLDVGDYCNGIGADASGSFYVLCGTYPRAQPTPGAFSNGTNVYVAKLDPSGSKLLFGAAFGSSSVDYADFATIDSAGNVTVTGRTYSTDFPTTPNAAVQSFQYSASQYFVSFVSKLNASGTGFVYSTLGKANESPRGLALDAAGNAQIVTEDGDGNLLVRRYNADGSAVKFESSLKIPSPAGRDYLMGLDNTGVTTVLGSTTAVNFPLLRATQTCQSARFNSSNSFLVRLGDSGTVLQSTFFAGTAPSQFRSLVAGPDAVSLAVWRSPLAGPQLFQLEVLTIAGDANAQIKLACVGNAATLVGHAIAPGEILSLFGEGIGPATPESARLGPDQRFPTTLAQTQVTFDGVAAPLLYASDRQIDAVSPFALASSTEICVIFAGVKTNCIMAGVRPADPGIFLAAPPISRAAAINQDGTVNSQQNPAAPGSIVSLYATGLGAITPPVPDGALIPFPLPLQNLKIAVLIPYPDSHHPYPPPWFGEVSYAGPAPLQIAGVSQVNVRVPSGPVSFTLQVTLPDGSTTVSKGVTIWTAPPK